MITLPTSSYRHPSFILACLRSVPNVCIYQDVVYAIPPPEANLNLYPALCPRTHHARTLLPAGILDRKKQGFGVPLGVWFRGGLTDVFSDVLRSPTTRQRGYFEPGFIDRLVGEHLSGKRDHTLRLWQLLVFELWHRQYLDRAVPSATPVERRVLAVR